MAAARSSRKAAAFFEVRREKATKPATSTVMMPLASRADTILAAMLALALIPRG